jgi:hypothetical protein
MVCVCVCVCDVALSVAATRLSDSNPVRRPSVHIVSPICMSCSRTDRQLLRLHFCLSINLLD